MHLVTHGHSGHAAKMVSHTTRYAVSENPMLHANFMALCSIHRVSYKKEPEPNSVYFDNHKFKLHKNHSTHACIIVHCDYEINVVGFCDDS